VGFRSIAVSLCLIGNDHPFVPTCLLAERRAQRQSSARAWAFATTHPRHYIPVLLDGLEMTSLDLWLPSLVEEISSIRRPANLLLLASLGEKIIDRAHFPEHLGDLVVPVLPETNAEISAALMAKAGGPAPPTFALDCANVSRPTRGEMLEILEELTLPPNRDPTEILCWIPRLGVFGT